MDESWRARMGMRTSPPPPRTNTLRRSAEDTPTFHRRRNTISDDPLNPEDFNDVFGGPPRTILSRQFSTGFQKSPSSSAGFSYAEIFRPPVGRILPEFRIPGQQSNDFYSDIFGCGEDHERVVRSRSRSKASSSSVLSSEERSPLRSAVSVTGYDDASDFGSKLRPMNVESRWASRRMAFEEKKRGQENMMPPPFADFSQPFHNYSPHHDGHKSYFFGLSRRDVSPETISLEPIPNGSFPVSADDLDLDSSPSSPVSSICQSSMQDRKMEDEYMNSYVIEINAENKEGTCESNGVEEAIAWAKEKFQMKSPTEEMSNGYGVSDQEHMDSFGSSAGRQDKCESEEETEQFDYTVQTEMRILDAKISLWSTGKGGDIRLLLSSLHNILWPDCGWLAMPATNLTKVSQVKKAYQKARLCLHPDKLQQRGATVPQKHIAKKAFYVLQDAWAAFVTQEIL